MNGVDMEGETKLSYLVRDALQPTNRNAIKSNFINIWHKYLLSFQIKFQELGRKVVIEEEEEGKN